MLFFLILSIVCFQASVPAITLGKKITFSAREAANQPRVFINEIMFDPEPSQGLPPIEYIELYNMDSLPAQLKNWKINDAVIPDYVFLPGTFLILCKAGQENGFVPAGEVIGVSPWDVLNNEGQEIILQDGKGNLIDRIYYTPGLIHEHDKKSGGWSIELINPSEKCLGIINWKVTRDPTGGTPGRINSVYSDAPNHTIPILTDHEWSSPDTLQMKFSRPVDILSDHPTGYFTFNPYLEIRKILTSEEDIGHIRLITVRPVEKGKAYNLALTGLSDCLGNEMKDTVIQTGIGLEPSFLDLLITELLFDQVPSIGLPESEYIEIFNSSGKIMNLGDLLIVTRTDTFKIPGENIYPDQFRVFCPISRISLFKGITNVTGISPFPRLLNNGQVLALFNDHHQLVFSLAYDKTWYRDMEKSEGGYSIEMIDYLNPCGDDKNWSVSENPAGGTPGKPNSISQTIPDREGPGIKRIYMPEPNRIQVALTEKIHPNSTGDLGIIIPDRKDLRLLSFDSLFYNRFTLSVDDPLSASTRYELSIQGLRDCVGNTMDPVSSQTYFYLPRPPGKGDLVINEILFNPRPGGVDWVEIFNTSMDYIDLTGLILCNFNDGHPENQIILDPPYQVIPPSGFLVITEDQNQLMSDFPLSRPEAISQVVSMPPMPDQFGNIALISMDHDILDHFYYFSSYHHALITDDEGISLERISYTGSTNHPGNWQSASSNAGYGTPTHRNSAHRSSTGPAVMISLHPSIISPDGDGRDDQLNIHYSIGHSGYVGNIEIYDIAGHCVKGIVQNRLLGTEGIITWDGYSESGQIPGTGIYLLRFEVYNLLGDRWVSKKKFVISRKF